MSNDIPDATPSSTDRIQMRILSLPGVAAIVVFAVIVIAIGKFTNAVSDIVAVFGFAPPTATGELRIRYKSYSYGNVSTVVFFVDNLSMDNLHLDRVDVVSTQRNGKNLWEHTNLSSGTRDTEFGKGLHIAHCGEYNFQHELDEIPTTFSRELFPIGTTRKFYAKIGGPELMTGDVLDPEISTLSRVEIYALGEIVATEDITDSLDQEFWTMILN